MTLTASKRLELGASAHGGETHFRVWAPNAGEAVARIIGRGDFPLDRDQHGVFSATLPARAGDRYFYILDGGTPIPDPVSRLLPEGVHGPTEIVDPEAFPWNDHTWKGLDFRDYILYELHVGTFTSSGTFDGVIEKLPYLKSLGVTAVELMPVAANPGKRNWGYDAVSPYAVQENYGGPEGLRRLVDAAHRAGLAVVIDVIYNHLGNEGNYLQQFGPYFTDKHQTPWGEAINYDQPGCERVREYVRENALYWIREYHADGLRLDATQTIKDDSPRHVVAEIAAAVHRLEAELGRMVTVVAETDENDARYLRRREEGGFGVDGVWSDDFHHAVHALLTGENKGYYGDFAGKPELLARVLNEGFGYQGEPFAFWKGKPRGSSTDGIPLYRHVICTQNHDQVGNRAQGERLNPLVVSYGARKVAAAILLLAPHTPLLFMGQEYDEANPFQFFTDYGDPVLQEAVREGRRSEFADFAWDEVPDPQDSKTFERSRLSWIGGGNHGEMLDWYRQLISLRKRVVISSERTCRAQWNNGVLRMELPAHDARLLLVAAFRTTSPEPGDGWERAIWMERDGYSVGVYRRK
ncbi:MAG: malto-oligosyltrehalose trehalohydrolase [Terriglobales bacterium]